LVLKNIHVLQGDVRELKMGEAQFDIIMAAAVLHHLRGDEEWHDVFAKFHRALRPGGSVWISDLVTHSTEAVQQLMWRRYGEYLTQLKDESIASRFCLHRQRRHAAPAPISD
jgi:tRNA (cmo5U34)-methyltransferase